jgi:hypothetical protein
MKHITTDKHPELKAEIIFIEDELCNGTAFFSRLCGLRINHHEKDDWFSRGWLKELQEPEFTKDDMIRYASFHLNMRDNFRMSLDASFSQWLEKKKLVMSRK